MGHQKSCLELIAGFMGFTVILTQLIEPTMAAGPQVAEAKLDGAVAAAKEAGQNLAVRASITLPRVFTRQKARTCY